MRRFVRLLVYGLLLTVAGLVVWQAATVTAPSYSHGFGEHDFGNRRLLKIWVTPHFGDPSSIWFEASQGRFQFGPRRCLGTLDASHYEVRTVWVRGGEISCTYAVGGGHVVFVYVDWPNRQTWPGDERPDTVEEWTAVRRQLTADYPDLPRDPSLEQDR